MKIVKVREDKETNEVYICLHEILDNTQIFDKVIFYEIKENNGNLLIRFFDKDKNLLKIEN